MSKSDGVVVSIYTDIKTAKELKKIAKKEKTSLSRLATEMFKTSINNYREAAACKSNQQH